MKITAAEASRRVEALPNHGVDFEGALVLHGSELAALLNAAKAEGMEEAAKIAENTCEGGCSGCDGDSGFDFHGENSAERIRAEAAKLLEG